MFGGAFNDIAFDTQYSEPNYVDLSADLSGNGRVYSRKVEIPGDDAGRFGSIAFDRGSDEVEYEYALDFAMTASASADFSGAATTTADFVRDIWLEAERMSGEGRTTADFIRDIRLDEIRLSGEGRINASASRFHVDVISFTGRFAPGDLIVIDTKKLQITQNGVNALRRFRGDLRTLRLMPDKNVVTYNDAVGVRRIAARVTFRDKFK